MIPEKWFSRSQAPAKKIGRPKTAVLLSLGLVLFLLSGCQPLAEFLVPPGETGIYSPDETGEVRESEAVHETSAVMPDPTPQPTTSETQTENEWHTKLDDAFLDHAETLILAGLDQRQEEIALDELFERYWIAADQVEATIESLYDLYQSIYSRHPQYFYLSGSAKVSYSLLTGSESRIKSMRLIPQFWPSTARLSAGELDQMIAAVHEKVEQYATRIEAETQTPWHQLQLIHNQLIRSIEYDATENQDHNHAGSALLDGLTLCQGYSQAFQLIAQHLGHDVRMITGESEGMGHAWNLVTLEGQVYHVDVTHDDPVPDGGPDHPVRHIHFLRSDDVMRETHQWDGSLYAPAYTDGAHYYRQNGLVVSDQQTLRQMMLNRLQTHDFERETIMLLEVLFSGEVPSREAVEAMFKDGLRDSGIQQKVYYRLSIRKNVVFLEVSLD